MKLLLHQPLLLKLKMPRPYININIHRGTLEPKTAVGYQLTVEHVRLQAFADGRLVTQRVSSGAVKKPDDINRLGPDSSDQLLLFG